MNPNFTEIEITIPDELEYFVAETAGILEMKQDELVRLSIGLYLDEHIRNRHHD